jgi:hypothetical protein
MQDAEQISGKKIHAPPGFAFEGDGVLVPVTWPRGLATAASKLFEIASENQQEKDGARRVAFDWLEETRSSIYDL